MGSKFGACPRQRHATRTQPRGAAAGSLTKAVKLCRAAAPHSAKIEVEATPLADV